MNKYESLQLWKKGKKEWNKWARKMLAQKDEIQEHLEIDEFDFYKPKDNHAGAAKWINDSTVYFAGHTFKEDADFSEFIFPGQVFFNHPHGLEYVPEGLEGKAGNVAIFKEKAIFRKAEFHGPVAFDGVKFEFQPKRHMLLLLNIEPEYCADFSDAIFYDIAEFYMCEFMFEASFNRAIFKGCTGFRKVNFRGYAWFRDAIFGELKPSQNNKNSCSQEVWFEKCTFHSESRFEGSEFFSKAFFRLATFNLPPHFNSHIYTSPLTRQGERESNNNANPPPKKTIFHNESDFSRIESKRGFNLGDVVFKCVPDFREANFHDPPDLDDMKIEESATQAKANDDHRKFRALRRIAESGQNHYLALELFAREVRSRRNVVDKCFGKGAGIYWWGLIYDLISNFGRSFVRPMLLWAFSTFVIFPLIYVIYASGGCNLGDALKFSAQCPFGDALMLSAQRGIIISGLWDNTLKQAVINRLFGDNIPNIVISYMTIQSIVSITFLFFFFLALRNHFRLR